MSDAHAGFGDPSGALGLGVLGDGRWHRVGADPESPSAPDIFADLRDITERMVRHEAADRYAMVTFIAARFGWKIAP